LLAARLVGCRKDDSPVLSSKLVSLDFIFVEIHQFFGVILETEKNICWAT